MVGRRAPLLGFAQHYTKLRVFIGWTWKNFNLFPRIFSSSRQVLPIKWSGDVIADRFLFAA
jgi:hypothetical protein